MENESKPSQKRTKLPPKSAAEVREWAQPRIAELVPVALAAIREVAEHSDNIKERERARRLLARYDRSFGKEN